MIALVAEYIGIIYERQFWKILDAILCHLKLLYSEFLLFNQKFLLFNQKFKEMMCLHSKKFPKLC